MGKLDGKVAFITGAARGQGRSHAIRLAGEGADIIAVDICEQIDSVPYPLATPEDLAATVKEVEALGRQIVAVKADVRERPTLQAALDEGLARFGHLDIVCANAGICPAIDSHLASGFVDGMDVDFVGVLNTVAVSLPHLGAGASVIVTGSTAGMMKGTTEAMGNTGGVAYSLAKKMIANYVEVLALQLAPASVRLNAIHPTNTNTHLLHNEVVYKAFRPDIVAEGRAPTREEAELAFPVMQAMPIPYVEPDDISSLVLFLASDDSRYITGLNLRVDAGAMLKTPMF
ncbi:mycofactocin-coupled SDR family oxidoreductase [Frankia sp. CNm7]|uniref:Mycofactocin-coupled SDR family oxidoreductase n=1 Tax=Frankia nepalensis TaxID=1836974 RepID=A0A937RE27_9ACTN|nr:mycofactocin-coupled SDR family oxidoreductase [Frankia nepalensis]MBL7499207.1 mycofactocin-coupled SDR family oxidoreductase [Frankia nepalensis]MBL7513667.1 mycofactocin-coupled SDR family oxidoreductase [Frankia nepalensis]MBL7524892.1 mycofactocin-coupled SDR family oxidoreductase [Frankia nepalensis]MBL7627280.1 mycofactocin-coupled SDR family oxidoreductase [Frankia nepalensis]